MYWQVVGVKMSSSRIIKSSTATDNNFSPFSFQAIHKDAPSIQVETKSSPFVPLALFDNSERQTSLGQAPPEPLPDGIFITEEELEQRLKESFNKGLTEGKNLAERGLFNVFKALRTSSEQILSLREKVMRDSEEELLNLVMLMARKVILREISQNRNILASIVHNAIAGLPEQDEITVRLHPDDYALVNNAALELIPAGVNRTRMLLKSDSTVSIGCCKVETAMGVIDATLDAQLDELYRSLKEEQSVAATVIP